MGCQGLIRSSLSLFLSSQVSLDLRCYSHFVTPTIFLTWFANRERGADDILLRVLYCGVDHTDLHQVRGEIGKTNYPLVPG